MHVSCGPQATATLIARASTSVKPVVASPYDPSPMCRGGVGVRICFGGARSRFWRYSSILDLVVGSHAHCVLTGANLQLLLHVEQLHKRCAIQTCSSKHWMAISPACQHWCLTWFLCRLLLLPLYPDTQPLGRCTAPPLTALFADVGGLFAFFLTLLLHTRPVSCA